MRDGMRRHWIFVLLLLGSFAVATASFAAGENSGTGGEHNGAFDTNCGHLGDEC